jgi:hypothetical protein
VKAIALIGAGVVALVAAFVLLPRLALNLSGNSGANNSNAPFVKAASASPRASGTPAVADPIISFADLAAKAGFTPLDPGVVPAGFVPAGRYVTAGDAPIVVFAFRNAAGRFLLITERKTPPRQSGSDSFNNRPGRGAFTGATPRPDAPQQVLLRDGVTALYIASDRRLTQCSASDPTAKYTCSDQAAQDVRYSVGSIDVLVAADGRDLSREDMLKIAEGLR